jgi:hypothetical protein
MAHVWLRLAEDNHEMVARSKAAEEAQPAVQRARQAAWPPMSMMNARRFRKCEPFADDGAHSQGSIALSPSFACSPACQN